MFNTELGYLVHREQLRDEIANTEREEIARQARRQADTRQLQVGLVISGLLGLPIVVYALANAVSFAK
jgi:hypothetical protein